MVRTRVSKSRYGPPHWLCGHPQRNALSLGMTRSRDRDRESREVGNDRLPTSLWREAREAFLWE